MGRLGNKTQRWKKVVFEGLEAAKAKLQHYYRETYQFHGVIYAIATILDPCQKISVIRTASWLDNNKYWDCKYQQMLKKIFNYYRAKKIQIPKLK
jgi:hypothetical protein